MAVTCFPRIYEARELGLPPLPTLTHVESISPPLCCINSLFEATPLGNGAVIRGSFIVSHLVPEQTSDPVAPAHSAFHVPLRIALAEVLAFVIGVFAAGDRQFDLGPGPAEIDTEGHESVAPFPGAGR